MIAKETFYTSKNGVGDYKCGFTVQAVMSKGKHSVHEFTVSSANVTERHESFVVIGAENDMEFINSVDSIRV